MNAKETRRLIGCGTVLFCLLLIGIFSALEKTPFQQPFRMTAPAEPQSPYLGETATEAQEKMGQPDYQRRANEPNPHGVETKAYNLPNGGSLQIIVSDNKIVCINAYDRQWTSTRHEIDKEWFKGFDVEQQTRDFNR